MSDRAPYHHIYVGTYTRGESRGIYLCRLDAGTGELTAPEPVGEAENPSFLALDPAGRFLYAASEAADSAAVAFAVGEDGHLTRLNEQPSHGSYLCHLALHPSGQMLIGANYGSGNVAVWPIGPAGRLGEAGQVIQHEGSSAHPKRQTGPHAHSVTLSPDGRFAYAADLGIDKVMIYRVDAEAGRLTPNDPPWLAVAPGSGPRHMAFHPTGRWAYVIHEIGNTVSALTWDAETGALEEVQTAATLPAGFDGPSTTADVHVARSGRFLYGSNRGHDSLAIYAIDPTRGTLTCRGHEPTGGRTPRSFALDPSGRFLVAANQDGDNLVVFAVDAETGLLTPTGCAQPIPAPVCVRFLGP